MRKIILAATAIATLTVASPALADGDNLSTDTETYTINAVNPPKCNIVTESQTYNLGANQVSDNDGFASDSLDDAVASLLTSANITAWCTGNANALAMSRSALTTGDGQTTNGFNQAVVYDIQVNIADLQRAGGGAVDEGTSDGPGNGPGVGVGAAVPITRFGPTGAGSLLTFVSEPGSTVDGVGNGSNSAEAPRAAYAANDSARLVAGTYTGTVTLTLTPGL